MAFDPASIQPHQLEKIHGLSDSDRPDLLCYLLDQTGLQKMIFVTVPNQLGLFRQIALNQTSLISAAQLVKMFNLAHLLPAGEQDAKDFVDHLAEQMYDNSHAFWPDECDMVACKAASEMLFGAVRRYCYDEDVADGAAGAIPA